MQASILISSLNVDMKYKQGTDTNNTNLETEIWFAKLSTGGDWDPYTRFYTKIIVEHKMEKDFYKVLEALQEMGSKMLTSAQGKKDEKETSMYGGGTSASIKQITGHQIDDW